jgi:hypothetical protein
MTISDMHILFKIFLDKNAKTNVGFEPEEIDLFINLAIQRKIKTIMDRKITYAFEEVDYKTKDISTLITPFSTTTFTQPIGCWGNFVTLPQNFYRYVLWESCKVSYTDCNGNEATKTLNDCIVVPHNNYQDYIQNPFTRPDDNTFLRATFSYEDNTIYYAGHDLIFNSGQTPKEYNMRYIRKPANVRYGSTYSVPTIDINCDLPEHVHEELIREAAEIAIASIMQIDINVSQNQISKQE